ncbi:DUF4112 domain-containing protein [Pseudoponticoccus marisrubri]|uniref:DUF4112 domain-containing protein n=1 Tax=Pseudoponticoccus marisrubri TaxID=1685382 RepID=A0A0W7WMX5_9RHOB|nr:DUF4112 domain-containing protein [Pseudoponticoccus marisrubri]KUF11949.1 hypothetical protein AVJ23_05055 [Pseudoponticoccus marisrubri]
MAAATQTRPAQADFDRVETAERVARRMDSAFRLPLTRITIGWDSIIGLVPGVGDALALAPAAYILKLAHDSGASRPLLARMAGNVGLDWLIGLVPLLGDVLDVGFKANLRNAALLRAHVEARHATVARPPVAPVEAAPA